jgi:SAM-dependent methyltransferase
MQRVTEREQFLRAFHDARPGITSRALARAGSYTRLAKLVPAGRVLDLACGDGALLELFGPHAIGLDLSRGELARARARVTSTSTISAHLVQARAQQLPFRDATFDAATCHLAFMLFDDIDSVVAELARVLKPGAPFIALLGGGPSADGDDAFDRFVELQSMSITARPTADAMTGRGDRRASTEAGWHELFAGWRDITFERWPLDLGGSFDEVWTFLSSSYQLRDGDRIRDQLRAEFSGDHVPCIAATYCATVRR